MEASDTSNQTTDQVDGSQDPAQPEADSSQESPTQDSGLQTPQPDQPVPTETERTSSTPSEDVTDPNSVFQQDESAGEAPTRNAPRGAPVATVPDAAADETQRQSELNRQRRVHNAAAGGGQVQDGELQRARQDHNDRVGGGQVPGANSVDDGPIDRGE